MAGIKISAKDGSNGIKMREDFRFHGKLISATFVREKDGRWYAAISCRLSSVPKIPVKSHDWVGVDVGLKDLSVLSNGDKFSNPKPLKSAQKRMARLQRSLSRKRKGGSNYGKARQKLAIAHIRVANIRKDNLHKVSTVIAKTFHSVVVETLNVKGMLKNHSLARSISDVGWGMFVTMLEYKTRLYGGRLIKADRWYPSSQTCSHCGEKHAFVKNLQVRQWTCGKCGETHDRDVNAAKNLVQWGKQYVASKTGCAMVRTDSLAVPVT